MPRTPYDSDDFDPQDLAETFDESMTVGGEGDVSLGGESPVNPAEDMRTFEEMPDVYDVTSRFGDRDRDEGLAFDADEFSDDAFDDVVARAVDPSGRDYGTMLPMKEIK